jgi:eukaryotic-like serine/threonine-protein kinase
MVVTNVAAPKPTELLGRRIAGYELDEVIGAGGMGAIYGATSQFVKKRAAVKVMLNEFTENSEVVGRFLQEAFVASAVDHPNVVEIWAADRFEEDRRMYILMPLIEGSSLETLCESVGPLGFDAAATIALQIAAGLDAVHKLGVVHRDIKPANILIAQKDGLKHFVKIVDFGVARLLAPHLVGISTGRRTRTNMVIGTAGSMAPEQAAGARDVDARADIYSWGVVMYLMLTGRPPHQGDSVWDLVERARTGAPFPRPRALRPDIPRAWEDVIMASLELYPNRRPSSMSEVATSIAKPLPNGELMLSTLARNLLPGARLGVSDKTLTGALEERWSIVRPPAGRRARALPIAMALAAGFGAAAGVVGVQLAGDEPRDEPGRSAQGGGSNGAAAPDAAMAHIPAVDAGIGGSLPADASGPTLQLPPDAPATGNDPTRRGPPAPAPGSAGGPASGSAGTETEGQVAQDGLIIVRSSPWSRVWIDGESLGQTAVRRPVTPGTHRIRLVGPDDKTKDFTRDVKAGETATLRWDW